MSVPNCKLACILLLLTACSAQPERASAPDAGPGSKPSPLPDSGGDAASAALDAASAADAAEPPLDASAVLDASDAPDTGDARAAGDELDASEALDASDVSDAGAPDAGAPDASAPDASTPADAGVVVDAGPPLGPRFAADVLPILVAGCGRNGCHAAAGAPFGLNLSSASAAHAGLVGAMSAQCPSVARVAPGDPSSSYLVWKLQGSGPCYSGARMPIGAAPLGAADQATIEAWIARGAPND